MYNDDYERVAYNINERINKQINPDFYNFNGEITEHHKNMYDKEKKRKIQLNVTADLRFNVDLWDVCFASKWGFPNNSMGFYGQWMRKKLAPLANHLSGIDLNESVHICYRLIEETDENTLDYLCDNIKYGNIDFKGRKGSGCGEDNIITYNKHIQDGLYSWSFDSFNYLYHCMEREPIKYICPSYNNFYLVSKDARNGNDTYITISEYKDIEEKLIHIYNCSSYLYDERENDFDTLQEQWLLLIDKIKRFFDVVGHDKPFWTAYLPEDINIFEEVRVLTNCGNFINVIARSKKYFYFMQLVK